MKFYDQNYQLLIENSESHDVYKIAVDFQIREILS